MPDLLDDPIVAGWHIAKRAVRYAWRVSSQAGRDLCARWRWWRAQDAADRKRAAAATATPPSAPRCLHCGGALEHAVIAERNLAAQAGGCLLFVVGVVLSLVTLLTIIGPLIGLALCLIACGVGYRRRKVWRCTACRAVVDRG